MNRLLQFRALPYLSGGGLFALVLLWTFTATPRYRSAALLQMDASRATPSMGDLVAGIPGSDLLGLGKNELETQVGVLRSRRVLDAVMDSLGLDVSVTAPAPDGEPMIFARSRRDGARSVEGSLTLHAAASGVWTLQDAEITPELSLPTSLREGDTLRVGPHEIQLARGLSARGIEELEIGFAPRYLTRRSVEARLDVRQQSAGAQLIALTFDDTDPLRAAAVLERTLAEYLDFSTASVRGDAGTTVAELRRQVGEQQARLTEAENAMRAYQERTGLVLPAEQGSAQIQRYAKLRSTLDQLEVERDASARLAAIVDSRALREPGSSAYRQLGTFPGLIGNRAIQDLLLALLTLENDRSELLLLRSAENPDVRRIGQRIVEIESDLQRIGSQYLESLDQQIAPTRAAMQAIDADLATLPDREMRFLRLQRERMILNEGYVALQQQLRLTEVQDALRLDAVRIVDAAIAAHPDDPYFPRVPVHIALAIVLALASAGAVAALQSALRRSGVASDA